MTVELLIVTGPVGAGKSSVAVAIYDLLSEIGQSRHALIDMDAMRMGYPSPPDDPFNMELGYRNLGSVAANFRAVGAQRLIVPDVIETRANVQSYQSAIPDANITVVRLTAKLETLHKRLHQRETGASLDWHLNRAGELLALMDERHVEDWLIETDDLPMREVAQTILNKIQ